MSDKYKELRELAEKATPGPWKCEIQNGDTHLLASDGGSMMCDMRYYPWVPPVNDFQYIAAANPSTIAALLAERDALLEALRNIADPIAYLIKEASANGDKLNGLIAIELSKDSGFLKNIALDAIKAAKRQEAV